MKNFVCGSSSLTLKQKTFKCGSSHTTNLKAVQYCAKKRYVSTRIFDIKILLQIKEWEL